MVSGVSMSVCLAGLAVYLHLESHFALKEEDESTSSFVQSFGWIPLLCLMSFIVAYSIGFGAVPHLVMGEIFPASYRHQLSTISASLNLCTSFLVVRTFPELTAALGFVGVYGLYAGCSLAAAFFVFFFLPETKGQTLEDIGQFFGAKPERPAVHELHNLNG